MRYLISLLLANLLFWQPAFAINEVDKQNIFSKNILQNGGFENGKAKWTASAGTFAVTTTSPMEGLQHATWDAAASGNTLTSTAVTIKAGQFTRNGVASCLFTTASGTATHEIQIYDGSNVINEVSITSSTNPTRASVNFGFPSSGSISLRIYANADEPSIAIDDCYLGPAEGYNVSSVSQATLVGHAYYGSTTNCTGWARTNTAMGDFSSDADCPAPTVVSNVGPGTISTTDNNLPQITVTNLPPGRYEVKAIAPMAGSAGAFYRMAVTDGTTTSAAAGANPSTTTNESITIIGVFTYTTTQSSVTFKLQGMSSSGTLTMTNDYYETQFFIYRFPTSSEQAYTPDLQAMSWSGYHASTCSWARTNTAFGAVTDDATCSLTETTNQGFGTVSTSGSVSPAITFTPKKAGRYFVCALPKIYVGTANVSAGVRLWDGTTVISEAESVAATTSNGGVLTQPLCGIYVVTNTSAKTLTLQTRISSGTVYIAATAATNAVEWSIFSLDQSIPAPVLVGSITSSSSGSDKIERARASSTCSSTPCTLASSTAGISSVSRSGAGDYTINFVSGTFSVTPTCVITPGDVSGVGDVRLTSISSTTQKSFATFNNGGTLTDTSFDILCMGAR